MKYEYNQDADSGYVFINDLAHSYSMEVDETRFVDYSEDGTVIGIELLYIGSGVDTSDLPYRDEIIALLEKNHVKLVA